MSYPAQRKRRTDYPSGSCPTCGRVMPVCSLPGHERTHETHGAGSVPLDDQQRIVELYNRPRASLRSVAAATNWSETTVLRVLRAHDVVMRPQGSSHPLLSTEEQLRRTQLYGRGLSLEEVAELSGVTREAIRQTLIRNGVRIRGKANLRWTRQRRSDAREAA